MLFSLLLGRLPFVRTDRPDHSRRNDNFLFNQNSPGRLVKSWIVFTKGDGFSAKTLGKSHFIFKLTGRAVVRPASSDKWKAPLVNPFTANNRACKRRRISGRRFSRLCSQAMLIRAKVRKYIYSNFVSENPNIWIATPFRILSQMQKLECQIISPLISLEGKWLRFLCSFLCG